MRARDISILAVVALSLCGLIVYLILFVPHERPFRPLQQSAPCLSPDGKKLLFDLASGDGCLVAVQELSNGRFQALSSAPTNCFHPIWSADGKRIFFARMNRRFHNLWSMEADGSAWKQITSGNVLDVPLTTSSDGSRVYFLRENWKGRFGLPIYEIWSIDPRQNQTQPVFIDQGLTISADGGAVAMMVQTNDQPRPPTVAVKMAANGPVSVIGTEGYSPALSPNGKQLAYVRRGRNWNGVVCLTKLDSWSTEVLDDSPGVKSEPVFSSDGSNILFRSFSSNETDCAMVIISLTDKSKIRIPITAK